jgi:predicted TIM-barrel fold metal-dependent hydrolase
MLSLLAAGWLLAGGALAQAVDPELERFIAGIPAIDNHTHPNRCVAEGEPADDEADQIPVEGFPEPVVPAIAGLDPADPFVAEAWQALYGVAPGADQATALAAKRRAQREHGDAYASWILDRMGIETMLANRIALGRCLAAPRFAFVPFADAFLFPLSNAALRRESVDTGISVGGAERLFARYREAAGLAELPRDLAGYLRQVVTPTLERLRREGAVAIKFEAAYIRPLTFAPATEADAARTYAKFVRGGEPPASDYRQLQDFLFGHVAREAGRLGLVVHLHALGIGAGPYYEGARSDPWGFEPMLNDPVLRGTNFLFVHGGWPWTDDVGALLLAKPNLYADISALTFTLSPRALADVLRNWLALAPDKVLFGTDAFGLTPAAGWEELAWNETRSARRALGIALSEMLRDGEIDRARAEQLARGVMRGNAARLYGLESPAGSP